jgi:uncharacterized protein
MQSLISVFVISYHSLIQLLPYVVAGVLFSESLKFADWADYLKSLPGRAPLMMIILAAMAGMASPLCTYGTIPMVIALFSLGFPLHMLVTFLVASSLMNPQLFLLTWGGIGLKFVLAQVMSVLVFSILLGITIQFLNPIWIINPNIQNNQSKHHNSRSKFSLSTFFKNNLNTLQFIGFYIILGILLGAVIQVYVPSKLFLLLFQSHQWLGVLLGAVLGVPLYACGGGTIPLVKSMMVNGMSSGAALAFFIVGPATRVTPLMALATIIRARFLILYISVLVVFAVTAGLLYAFISS